VNGKDVRPKKWKKVIDLYDDGEYSAIWGNYNKSPKRVLGVRWNKSDHHNIGYPNMAGHPIWYVEPTFLAKSIILHLKNTLKNKKISSGDINKFNENIEIALKELN